jgi:hypothetical protein
VNCVFLAAVFQDSLKNEQPEEVCRILTFCWTRHTTQLSSSDGPSWGLSKLEHPFKSYIKHRVGLAEIRHKIFASPTHSA